MTRLVIVVETEPVDDGGPDEMSVDPAEIASALVSEWNDDVRAQGGIGDRLSVVHAAWADTLPRDVIGRLTP